ncbi:MAG: EF-P beta-lysylation protein EpmB [Gammaproteobacteria bacterium]|nr:EF-P beta-lysylation protein EpmB [Gammaproteobacteria bacterium]
MIPRTPALIEVRDVDASEIPLHLTAEPRWQRLLADAIEDPAELLRRLDLPESLLEGAQAGARLFRQRVPAPFIARMQPGNPQDPLLRQVLPLHAETETTTGFVTDPLGEIPRSSNHGIIRKYRSRALLVLTGACAVNCRFCFRRHYPYQEFHWQRTTQDQALAQIAADPDINEVILSGGDPLASNDRQLAQLVSALDRIPHLRRLRIHTRFPVVIPQRVDDALLDWLRKTRLQTIIVLHVNHPQEMDEALASAAARLRDAGATLLNQSTLLGGINDQVDTLVQLSETLFARGILPYYLHAFDPVAGAAHFAVSDERARELARGLLEHLPGYLVPRLVREVPGASSKWPLDLGLA